MYAMVMRIECASFSPPSFFFVGLKTRRMTHLELEVDCDESDARDD
jgi:hypothetical protein